MNLRDLIKREEGRALLFMTFLFTVFLPFCWMLLKALAEPESNQIPEIPE